MKLSEMMDNIGIQRLIDTISIGTLLGTLAGLLPSIASLVTILWGLIRIYETKTVQKLFKKHNDNK